MKCLVLLAFVALSNAMPQSLFLVPSEVGGGLQTLNPEELQMFQETLSPILASSKAKQEAATLASKPSVPAEQTAAPAMGAHVTEAEAAEAAEAELAAQAEAAEAELAAQAEAAEAAELAEAEAAEAAEAELAAQAEAAEAELAAQAEAAEVEVVPVAEVAA